MTSIPIYDSAKTGNNIKNLRLKNNLTQEKLAEEFGLTAQCIYSYEIGRTTPPYEVMVAFANFFNCNVEDIYCVEYV